MKYIKINIALFFVLSVSLFISGCYTVIWTPEREFPDENNYSSYSGGYYYYDEYHYYYDYPWWLEITPPTKTIKYDRSNDKNISTIRNNDGSRRNSDSRGEILDTPPPTRSGSTGNNNSGTKQEVTKERNSGSSSGTSNTTTRQSSDSSSNNNVRNNDGTRNNNGRR